MDGCTASFCRLAVPTRTASVLSDGSAVSLKRTFTTAEHALAWVDSATGLRFREKWVAGSEVARVVSRWLVAVTPSRSLAQPGFGGNVISRRARRIRGLTRLAARVGIPPQFAPSQGFVGTRCDRRRGGLRSANNETL